MSNTLNEITTQQSDGGKFTVGQKVVCIEAECSSSALAHLRCYTVQRVVGGRVILVECRDKVLWFSEHFEDYDKWASHQVPVASSLTGREQKLVCALRAITSMYEGDYTLRNARWAAQDVLMEFGL